MRRSPVFLASLLVFSGGCSSILGADFDQGDASAANTDDVGPNGSSADGGRVKTGFVGPTENDAGTSVTTTSGQGTAGNDVPDGGGSGLITVSPDSNAVGEVSLSHRGDGTWSASAQFVPAPTESGVNCSTAYQESTCLVQLCAIAITPGLAPHFESATHLNAGTVTVSGVFGSIGLSAQSDGSYVAAGAPSTGLASTLQAVASGDAFPAFAVTAPQPASLQIKSPSASTTATTLSTASPLVVEWTGAGQGTAILQLEGMDSTQLYETACRFDASAGSGTIPAAVLQFMLPTSGEISLQGVVTSQTSKTFGSGAVTFDVYEPIRATDGTVYKSLLETP